MGQGLPATIFAAHLSTGVENGTGVAGNTDLRCSSCQQELAMGQGLPT